MIDIKQNNAPEVQFLKDKIIAVVAHLISCLQLNRFFLRPPRQSQDLEVSIGGKINTK